MWTASDPHYQRCAWQHHGCIYPDESRLIKIFNRAYRTFEACQETANRGDDEVDEGERDFWQRASAAATERHRQFQKQYDTHKNKWTGGVRTPRKGNAKDSGSMSKADVVKIVLLQKIE